MNNYYTVDYVKFELTGEQNTIIIIKSENEYGMEIKVAQYDFRENGYKFYYDLKGNKKEVARFSTIMNYLFKQKEYLGWDDQLVNTAKENAKRIKLEENKARKQELKQLDEKKASEMLNGIKNNESRYIKICENVKQYDNEKLYTMVQNTFKHASKKVINQVYNAIIEYNENGYIEATNQVETTVNEVAVTVEESIQEDTQTTQETTYTAFNRTFSTYNQALTYCNENDFSSEYIEEVVTMQPSLQRNEYTKEEQKEIFHLYKNTFDTYSQAYDYAIKNVIPVTMIISSKHPTMNNERLQQLQTSFTFDKMNMLYDDMKEYFNYLEPLPDTLDKQDIYYKLRSWINRIESQQKNREETKQRQYELAKRSAELLDYMTSNGLEIKEWYTYTDYYYYGEMVHRWKSGISIEEYTQGVEKVYNTYFKNTIAI